MRALCAALSFLFAFCAVTAVHPHVHVRTVPAVTTTEQK